MLFNYKVNFSDFTYITWSISINNLFLNYTFVDKMRNLFFSIYDYLYIMSHVNLR